MKYVSREELLSNNHRKVEAMYRKGRSIEEITLAIEDLSRIDVLDIVQKIFALDVKANRV